MCALCAGAKSTVVLEPEVDQEKSLDPSGPRLRCPLCDWSPRKDDRWAQMHHHSGRLSLGRARSLLRCDARSAAERPCREQQRLVPSAQNLLRISRVGETELFDG